MACANPTQRLDENTLSLELISPAQEIQQMSLMARICQMSKSAQDLGIQAIHLIQEPFQYSEHLLALVITTDTVLICEDVGHDIRIFSLQKIHFVNTKASRSRVPLCDFGCFVHRLGMCQGIFEKFFRQRLRLHFTPELGLDGPGFVFPDKLFHLTIIHQSQLGTESGTDPNPVGIDIFIGQIRIQQPFQNGGRRMTGTHALEPFMEQPQERLQILGRGVRCRGRGNEQTHYPDLQVCDRDRGKLLPP